MINPHRKRVAIYATTLFYVKKYTFRTNIINIFGETLYSI